MRRRPAGRLDPLRTGAGSRWAHTPARTRAPASGNCQFSQVPSPWPSQASQNIQNSLRLCNNSARRAGHLHFEGLLSMGTAWHQAGTDLGTCHHEREVWPVDRSLVCPTPQLAQQHSRAPPLVSQTAETVFASSTSHRVKGHAWPQQGLDHLSRIPRYFLQRVAASVAVISACNCRF